jgi:hypothetical protein
MEHKVNRTISMTGHVHEPHILCPKCSHQIPLTESLAAPLLEAERREFQKKLAAREVEELKRKLEQGSQQTQGEAFELELENLLRGKFPLDLIEPVAKGETGGDIVQTINGQLDAPAGVILWELKNTKNWSDTWLPKLRDNKRAAKADVALIISTALPKGVETFDLVDGVYVAHPRCAVPVALTLRQGLLEIANARATQAGQQSKAEQVYQYLTGSRFKQRIEAVVERFKDMREDIDKERKFMVKAWAKREAQVSAMIESTVGMVGDLHGIMGQAMPEIPAIDEPPMLEGKAA